MDGDEEVIFNYTDSKTVDVIIEYTDMNGTTDSYGYSIDADYNFNEETHKLKDFIEQAHYGYGDYTLKIIGMGYSYDPEAPEDERTGYDEDTVSFKYIPVTGAIDDSGSGEGGKKEGGIYVDLNYDKENEKIKKIVVEVYKDGKLVTELSPITVFPDEDTAELKFDDTNLPDGEYTIKIYAYNSLDNSNLLYSPYVLSYNYKRIKTPDTGKMFNNLRISQSDYLVTGLIVFSLVGISGLYFVTRNRSGSKKRK